MTHPDSPDTPKSSTTFVILAGAGDDRIRCCPNDMSTHPLQISNQMDVFMRSEMLEPTSVPIGLGTQAKIGAVNVPVILDELVTLHVL